MVDSPPKCCWLTVVQFLALSCGIMQPPSQVAYSLRVSLQGSRVQPNWVSLPQPQVSHMTSMYTLARTSQKGLANCKGSWEMKGNMGLLRRAYLGTLHGSAPGLLQVGFLSPLASIYDGLCLEQEQATLLVLTVTEWSRHLQALFTCGQLKKTE